MEVLKLLDGIVDIYMPDIKYGSNEPGKTYSGVSDYWDRCKEAIKEMHRQVGDLDIRTVACSEGGTATIAVRGLTMRHLVMPNGLAHTPEVALYLAEEVSVDTYINVMAQYHPRYLASRFPEISRPTTREEFTDALRKVREAGLHNIVE